MSPEFHLFIIWSNARHEEEKILADIKSRFQLLETIEIKWSSDLFHKNMCRFYGLDFRANGMDLKRRGNAPFLLVLVKDLSPKYETCLTSSGYSHININMLNSKERYRTWAGDPFVIHSTVTPVESRHNLAMLLGISVDDYLLTYNPDKTSQGNYRVIEQELIGEKPWASREQVFYILNETLSYVMLRDYKTHPKDLGRESDIDLLVDESSLHAASYILNATKEFDAVLNTYMFNVIIKKESIPFHLHSYQYIPAKWLLNILKTKIKGKSGTFIPAIKDQFFLLVYQLYFLKLSVKAKYHRILEELSTEIYGDSQPKIFDVYLDKTKKFLHDKNYQSFNSFYERQSTDIYYDLAKDHLSYLQLSDLTAYKVDLWKADKGAKFFLAKTKTGQKVFIKFLFNGSKKVKKEFELLSFFNGKHPDLFPAPHSYATSAHGYQFLITEFIEGEYLSKDIWGSLNQTKKIKLLKSLESLLIAFSESGFIHRDLDPSNILITQNSKVYIIDYEYMIDTREVVIKKESYVDSDLTTLYLLGEPNNQAPLEWNDYHSIISIFDLIDPSFKSTFPEFYNKMNGLKQLPHNTYIENKNDQKFLKNRIKNRIHLIAKKVKPLSEKIKRKLQA